MSSSLISCSSHSLGVPVSWPYCSCLRSESACIVARPVVAIPRFQAYRRLSTVCVVHITHCRHLSSLVPATHPGVPVSWPYCSCLRSESACIAVRLVAAGLRFSGLSSPVATVCVVHITHCRHLSSLAPATHPGVPVSWPYCSRLHSESAGIQPARPGFSGLSSPVTHVCVVLVTHCRRLSSLAPATHWACLFRGPIEAVFAPSLPALQLDPLQLDPLSGLSSPVKTVCVVRITHCRHLSSLVPATHPGVPVSRPYCSCLRYESACITARPVAARPAFRPIVACDDSLCRPYHALSSSLISCSSHSPGRTCFAALLQLSSLRVYLHCSPTCSSQASLFRPIIACGDCLYRLHHTRSSSLISCSSHSPGRACFVALLLLSALRFSVCACAPTRSSQTLLFGPIIACDDCLCRLCHTRLSSLISRSSHSPGRASFVALVQLSALRVACIAVRLVAARHYFSGLSSPVTTVCVVFVTHGCHLSSLVRATHPGVPVSWP
jgi:hypothetical protein